MFSFFTRLTFGESSSAQVEDPPEQPAIEPKFSGGGRGSLSRRDRLSKVIQAEDEEIIAFVSAFLCVYK